MNYNKAIVAGNLTRDPELKALPSGVAVTNFSIASNHVYYKDEAKVENAEFHNIVVFGKQAESVAKYLKKGSKALVEGRLQTRSWDGEGGTKHYRTEIIASNVQFGSSGNTTKESTAKEDPDFDGPPEVQEEAQAEAVLPPYPEDDSYINDIPF